MAIAPSGTWESSYDEKLKDSFKVAIDAVTSLLASQTFWQSWCFSNTTGFASTNPLFVTSATFSQAAFNPLPFGSGVPSTMLATAWKNYMAAAVWGIPPPAPPFSIIQSAATDPASLSSAHGILTAALAAEFLLLPAPDAFAAKTAAIAGFFRTATLSTSILLSGLSTGGPPAPITLVVPAG